MNTIKKFAPIFVLSFVFGFLLSRIFRLRQENAELRDLNDAAEDAKQSTFKSYCELFEQNAMLTRSFIERGNLTAKFENQASKYWALVMKQVDTIRNLMATNDRLTSINTNKDVRIGALQLYNTALENDNSRLYARKSNLEGKIVDLRAGYKTWRATAIILFVGALAYFALFGLAFTGDSQVTNLPAKAAYTTSTSASYMLGARATTTIEPVAQDIKTLRAQDFYAMQGVKFVLNPRERIIRSTKWLYQYDQSHHFYTVAFDGNGYDQVGALDWYYFKVVTLDGCTGEIREAELSRYNYPVKVVTKPCLGETVNGPVSELDTMSDATTIDADFVSDLILTNKQQRDQIDEQRQKLDLLERTSLTGTYTSLSWPTIGTSAHTIAIRRLTPATWLAKGETLIFEGKNELHWNRLVYSGGYLEYYSNSVIVTETGKPPVDGESYYVAKFVTDQGDHITQVWLTKDAAKAYKW